MDPSPPPASPTEDVDPDVGLVGDAVDGPVQPDAESGAGDGRGEFRESVDDALQAVRDFWSSDRATKLRFAGDLVALVPLVALLWWMANHDGGFERGFFVDAAVLFLVASPVAALEARHVPRWARWSLAIWALGILLSLLLAQERNFWVSATLPLAVVPLTGLFAHRISRRSWGPTVLLGLIILSFGTYAYRAFLTWWGDTLLDRTPDWRPLSWHNQSGTLMAAFGAGFLAAALTARGAVSGLLTVIAGSALAGAWLSGSRGALVAGAVGLVVAVAVGRRGEALPKQATKVAAVGLVAVLATGGLLLMQTREGSGGDGSTPLSARTQTASVSFTKRIEHMEAAARMLANDPLSGQGLGAYRVRALAFTDPDARLTASAHNEYLEVLGEGGLPLGVAFLGLHAAAAIAIVRRVRRPEVLDDEDGVDLRPALVAAGAAMIAVVGVHAAVDFDWLYPILPGLLAIGLAVQPHAAPQAAAPEPAAAEEDEEDEATPRTRRRWPQLAAVPLAGVLALAVVGAKMEERANADQGELSAEEFAAVPLPWQGDRAIDYALDLSRRDEHVLAFDLAVQAVTWNPGVADYRVMRDVVAYRSGATGPGLVLDSIAEHEPTFGIRNLAAEALIDGGDFDAAQRLVDETLAVYATYENWGVDAVRAESWYLAARVEAERGDCDAALAEIDQAVETGAVPEAAVEREFGPILAGCREA